MSDNLFTFTSTLSLADAKKLLAAIQKTGKDRQWQDWSGEGGFETEVKCEGLSASELAKLELPLYVSSIYIVSREMYGTANGSSLPRSLFLGGDEWTVPAYDCNSSIRCIVVLRGLDYPVYVCHTKQTERRFYGRKFNACEGFMIEARLSPEFSEVDFSTMPSAERVKEVLEELRVGFQFPGEGAKGILEYRPLGNGGFVYYLDPAVNDWPNHGFKDMVEKLMAESPLPSSELRAQIDIGSTLKFHGETRNVRDDAQVLLERIGLHNSYASYDLTYYVVGPQDWRGREKSRKKWKKPIYQELGTATLENGAVATAKLRIEKDGYVFTLDFQKEEDFFHFPETKLFEAVQWISGAE